jgi:hypothetical protein
MIRPVFFQCQEEEMAKFVNTSSAYAEIEGIVTKARQWIVLITPYIQMPKTLLDRIVDRSSSGVRVIIVCREKDLKPEQRNDLRRISSLELSFLENLHAKCFYNETTMVITSLNLYEASKENREMGILLAFDNDRELYDEARSEADFIIRTARPCQLHHTNPFSAQFNTSLADRDASIIYPTQNVPEKSGVEKAMGFLGALIGNMGNGYCIRCHTRIDNNPEKPLCADCYDKWHKFGNPDYKEKYCHNCGKAHSTSIAKPLCRDCYRRS